MNHSNRPFFEFDGNELLSFYHTQTKTKNYTNEMRLSSLFVTLKSHVKKKTILIFSEHIHLQNNYTNYPNKLFFGDLRDFCVYVHKVPCVI